MRGWRVKLALAATAAALLAILGSGDEGPRVPVTIPAGATLTEVSEVLASQGVIRSPGLFQLYARVRRADRKLKAGNYQLTVGSSMASALRSLTRGAVETLAITIPEGFQLQQMAPRIAEITGSSQDEIVAALAAPGLSAEYSLPGPGMEGYLFPDTYRFARGVPLEKIIETMVGRYRDLWTPHRLALLEESGMTEQEVVTLASIVQAEARHIEEMPRISGVYRNRLEAGWLLQADPTVLYALGGYRARLLYAAIDSVEDNPYNTYANRGLPPGPIASPGQDAIDAALSPEVHDFMYFVAWPDGSHIFTRSLAEHNEAKNEARGARASLRN
jgi:UPF0755 protein